MKKILLVTVAIISATLYSNENWDFIDFHHILGRCSGNNSFCSACKNCSGCKHCADYGGSCAVCYTPRAVVKKSTPARMAPARNKTVTRELWISQPRSPQSYQQKTHKNIENQAYNQLATSQTTDLTPSSETVMDGNLYSPAISNIDLPKQDYNVEIPEDAEFVIVTAIKANLRNGTSTKSGIIQKLNHNDLLVRLGKKNGWIKVQTLDSGEVGYVFENLLK